MVLPPRSRCGRQVVDLFDAISNSGFALVRILSRVAIALPLTLLRSLGEGSGTTPGDEPSRWVTVGTLTDIRDRGVVYDQATNTFVIAIGEDNPYAVWAATALPLVDGNGQAPRALYCESDHTFVEPGGDVYDQHGAYRSGPVQRGLGRFPVRVTNGIVQIDTVEATSSGSSNEQRSLVVSPRTASRSRTGPGSPWPPPPSSPRSPSGSPNQAWW